MKRRQMGSSQNRGVERESARVDTGRLTEALGRGGSKQARAAAFEKEITCRTDHRHPDDHRRMLSKDCRQHVAADPCCTRPGSHTVHRSPEGSGYSLLGSHTAHRPSRFAECVCMRACKLRVIDRMPHMPSSSVAHAGEREHVLAHMRKRTYTQINRNGNTHTSKCAQTSMSNPVGNRRGHGRGCCGSRDVFPCAQLRGS